MLDLPGGLTPKTFLRDVWQKKPLQMPQALPRVKPALTSNELGWLATLDDVESRLVFTEQVDGKTRYTAETGPFESSYLQQLPRRNWTLLVHDVEKHLPEFRQLLASVPFIPDWRIDDLMVSFAAPGGSVGPHLDQYDVFLCQGTGVRNWKFTTSNIATDSSASDDLALLMPFESGQSWDMRNGDVLYLPPGVAHWGVTKRACMTYSIGMRAPQESDLNPEFSDTLPERDPFYSDPDLDTSEARAGYISREALHRAMQMPSLTTAESTDVARNMGRFATACKAWLKPDPAADSDIERALDHLHAGGQLNVHGMASIAYDDANAFANGATMVISPADALFLNELSAARIVRDASDELRARQPLLIWLLKNGMFDVSELT
jgi:50S ribosomal protein L16 3-hydroxylase